MTLVIVLFGVMFALFTPSAHGQNGKPATLTQLAAYSKPDREQVLYAGAKGEGKVTWYTSLAGASYKDLAGAFESKYPGVQVESYRGTRAELGRDGSLTRRAVESSS